MMKQPPNVPLECGKPVAGGIEAAIGIEHDMRDSMNLPPQLSRSNRAWLPATLAVACVLVSPARSAADCDPGYELHAEYFTFGVGAKPASVATGDWNEDGHPDVVTATVDGRSLTLLLGSRGFHLRPGGEIGMGAAARWVVARDMNADGHLDLIATGDFGTSVLVGDGQGGFRTGATYPYSGTFLTLGDLNRDGASDIVLGGTTTGTTFLFLRGLDLDTVREFPYRAPQLGDFNEDGALDLATSGCGSVVWLNAGDGSFGPPTSYAAQCCTEWVSVGDVNGDHHLDLVGVSPYPACGVVLLGRGDGTFQDAFGGLAAELPSAPKDMRPPAGVSSRAPDGRMRQAQLAAPLISEAAWRLGGPLTGPAPQVPVLAPEDRGLAEDVGSAPEGALGSVRYGAHWIELADLDGDGRDEYITLSRQPGAELMGRRSLAFPTAAAVADMDGDGQLDVVVAGGQYWGTGPEEGAVAVHPGDGHGFIRRNPKTYIYPLWFVKLVDFNGDGIEDIASMGDYGLEILLRNPDGSPGRRLAGPGFYSFGYAFVDVNGDGNVDVLDGDPNLYLGNGDGTFQESPIWYFDTRLTGFDAGDVDEDGKADVLGIRWFHTRHGDLEGPLLLLRGNGDGTFRPATELGITAGQVKLRDLDGDGHLDLVSARWRDGASVFYGRGDGTFVVGPVLETSGHIFRLQHGDIDGDGRLDLLGDWQEEFGRSQAQGVVYRNMGRSYQRSTIELRGYPALGDVDGDGRDDVIAYGGAFHVYLSNGDGSFRWPLQEAYGPGGFALVDRTNRSPQQIFMFTEYYDDGYATVTLVENQRSPNRAPVTENARAVMTSAGAPNHGWAEVSVAGVSDPDGDAVSLEVTGITQDERAGSGSAGRGLSRGPHGDVDSEHARCPDAAIAGGQALVRWERAGSGNGRVYMIQFKATDGCGGTSTGHVTVCVPHDAASPECVDDGQRYNSLACEAGSAASAVAVELNDGLRTPEVRGGGAELRYALATAAMVKLEVYDLLGRKRAVVVSGKQPPGEYRARWEAQGAAGIYFARLSIGPASYVRRFALLK